MCRPLRAAGVQTLLRLTGLLILSAAGWPSQPGAEADDEGRAAPEPRLLRRFSVGEDDQIRCVCFTPDGQGVIAGTASGWIWVWDAGDADSGRKIRAASGDLLTGGVECITCSPDGKRLLAGGDDGDVRLVDLAASKAVRTLKGNGYQVESVAFLADGRRGLSANTGLFGDYPIHLWDLDDGKELYHVESTGYAASLDVSPDQKTFLSTEAEIIMREVDTGKVVKAFKGHRGRVYGAFLLPDDQEIVSGSFMEQVRIWDVNTGKIKQTVTEEGFHLNHLAVYAKGRLVLLGGEKEARLWDLSAGKERWRWDKLKGEVSVAFSADGCYALIADQWGCVRLWQLRKPSD